MRATWPQCAAQVGVPALLLAACGGSQLVTVPSGPQPVQARAVPVDFPPPPAKVEEIPLSHGAKNGCVWRDGFWDWTGRRWEWQPGRAVLTPAGCRFAEPKLEWTTDSLSFYRPAWYPDPAQTPPPKTCPEIACVSATGSATPPAE
jgi:hypothetical protein